METGVRLRLPFLVRGMQPPIQDTIRLFRQLSLARLESRRLHHGHDDPPNLFSYGTATRGPLHHVGWLPALDPREALISQYLGDTSAAVLQSLDLASVQFVLCVFKEP